MSLPGGYGSLRVIAGEFRGLKGPAPTFTPIHVWGLRLAGEQSLALPITEGYTTLLVVLKGPVDSGTEAIGTTEVGIFDRTGDHIRIDTLRMQQRFFSAVNRSMSRSWAAVPS